MIRLILVLSFLVPIRGFPIAWLQAIAENNNFDVENYLPKFGDLPKFEYSTNGHRKSEDILFKSHLQDDKIGRLNVLEELSKRNVTTTTTTTTVAPMATEAPEKLKSNVTSSENLDLSYLFDGNFTGSTSNDTLRFPRQEEFEVNNSTSSTDSEKESQEEEEEEDENMITGLLNSLLSGLSRPDGSIDLEAITGLLGSLSVQNPDGTYDFNGLTELLMSFFGGNDEDGGGSDFGAFVGGLAGAFLKGIAMPPGPNGAGMFVGKVAAGVLPALSGPSPAEGGGGPIADSGSFLTGFISSFLQGSSGLGSGSLGNSSSSSSGDGLGSSNSSGDKAEGSGSGSKFGLFKTIFGMITSIFTSSSSHKSK